MDLYKNDLKLIKKYTLILLDKHIISMKGKHEFVYRTFVCVVKIIENINVNISLFCFKSVFKDVIVLNDISFRYNR